MTDCPQHLEDLTLSKLQSNASQWLDFGDLDVFDSVTPAMEDLGAAWDSVLFHSDNHDSQPSPSVSMALMAGMSKEELRKHKNRASAARSRQRSRQKMEYLEEMVRSLENKNLQLQQTVQFLAHRRVAPDAFLPTLNDQMSATHLYSQP